ncbi:MAG TPA: hypothetical protein VF053_18365 [Streptosporangiales bacterium]
MTANRLDELCAVRGRLLPGEVVTVVAGVAAELARLHAARRVHGALDAAAVTIDPDGRPRLRGVRSADAAAADTAASAETDVRALARLAGRLLGPAPPRPVVEVLQEADAGRHTATSFAAALLEVCRPEPVRVPGERPVAPARRLVVRPAPPGRRAGYRLLPRPRPRVVAAVLTPFLLLGLLLLWSEFRPAGTGHDTHAGHGIPATRQPTAAVSTATPTPAPAPSGWLRRLDALDRVRAGAYARGDPAALRRVYVAGSSALTADTATLRRYLAEGLRVRDMRLDVSALSVVRHSPRSAVLAVTDRLGGYAVVDTAGRVVRHAPGRGPVRWRITLRNVGGRWLIADSRHA